MRILIADDDPLSRRLLESVLDKLGHEVVPVSDGSDAVAAFSNGDSPQIAILDWMMPGVDGIGVCRSIRERGGPYVYVILLTAKDGREDMLEALDSGADDFLTKPLNAIELRARLRSGTRVIELQERLLKAQEALRIEAAHDHLTGLWNRGMILEQLRREARRSKHEQRPFAIAMADIDFFKRVNDTHGHAVGDEVIRQTTARMRSAIRDYDFIGRYGGEEFLLVLPGCDIAWARQVAERVREKVSAEPIQAEGVELNVTVSLGLAWTPGVWEEPAALLAKADAALYRAKGKGRNRVEE